MTKKILYFDMDNVLVNFQSGIDQLSAETAQEYEDRYDEVPGIFALMKPIDGAVEAFEILAEYFDCYILSTAPWNNPTAWQDKIEWVHKYFGTTSETPAYKRLILSHHKNLNAGDFLVDDRIKHGVEKFVGEHIHFGQPEFPNWDVVREYLLARVN